MERIDPRAGSAHLQPWLHDLVITTAGNVTGLGATNGDLGGSAAQGIYIDDARVVSRCGVTLGGEPLEPVGWAALGPASEFVGSARHLGASGPDPTVEMHRRRLLRGDGAEETLTITSRAVQVAADLTVVLGGDGAEIALVKGGQATGALCPSVPSADGGSWRTARHGVTVVCDPAPVASTVDADGALRLTVPVLVDAGESVTVVLRLSAERIGASLFDADNGADLVSWPTSVSVTAGDARLAHAVRASLVDLRSLLLNDPEERSDVFAAAGSPWYLTLFGRDSIWSARLTLPLGTELAAGTLRVLARRQGTAHNADRAEDPGKIPHELRRVAYVDPNNRLELPPVYYGTVDATALWVCLLHDAWRWGMPEDQVRELLPALRSATTWLTDIAPGDDGLLRYIDEGGTGLVNQGWKDSSDSIRWRDGRVADAPIALIEAQAYAVEAARAAAVLLGALGGDHEADRVKQLLVYADRLESAVRQRFWVGDGADRYPAMALDGHGSAVTGLGSNMGHALGTGVFSAEESHRVTAVLSEPRMLGAHGIATFASDNGGFNPLGYHTGSVWTHDSAICALGMLREGHAGEAATVAQRLLDAAEAFDYRYPELFADTGVLGEPVPYPASCRPQAWSAASAVALLTIALGLSVDVPSRTVTVRPPPDLPFGPISVRGIRVGDVTVTVSVGTEGDVTVEGLPDGYTVVS
jgi:glycogen debranching enzyme